MKIKPLICIFLSSVLFLIQGCLENNVIPEFHSSLDNAAEMLVYFESQGDYINSMDAPSLIDAGEVYGNLSRYLVLDIRPAEQFLAGHIKGAVNLEIKNLIGYLKQSHPGLYDKIVLVSASGQASSYCTTLLRLCGYDNVYTMNFGMAAWNTDFSAIWSMNSKDSPQMKNYTNTSWEQNQFTSLPSVEFETTSKDIKDKIEERAAKLLQEGFNEDLPEGTGYVPGPAVTQSHLFPAGDVSKYYKICYGSGELYLAMGRYNPYAGLGHPAGVILYGFRSSLKSGNYLQTLPAGEPIGIYCFNGQFSASAAAYLRMLGYDAKSMLFGAHILFYNRLLYESVLAKYSFKNHADNHYPYVTG